jgi:hypothetical protein
VSFDKKEFKRNLAGSIFYPPVYGTVSTYQSKPSTRMGKKGRVVTKIE